MDNIIGMRDRSGGGGLHIELSLRRRRKLQSCEKWIGATIPEFISLGGVCFEW